MTASFLAVDDAGLALPLVRPERVGLAFGTGLGCLLSDAEFYEKVVAHGAPAASPRVFAYTVSSAAAGEVTIALGIHGPNTTRHMGMAAGAGALGYAADLIRAGRADVVLAGGADAHDVPLAEALRDMGLLKSAEQARPFVDATPGVWPSEGAAIAVLESAAHATARGAGLRARVLGHGEGFEPTLTSLAPIADGVVGAMRRALRDQARPDLVAGERAVRRSSAIERAALAAAGVGDVRIPGAEGEPG